MTAFYLAALLALLRIEGAKSATIQAVTLLFVGWLFGAFCESGQRGYLATALFVSIVELACFVLSI